MDGDEVGLDPGRDARRPPDHRGVARGARHGDHDPLGRLPQLAGRALASGGTRAAPPRSRRPRSAARARAAPPGSRPGRTRSARRAPCPPGRCCRAACGAAAGRPRSRSARAGRPRRTTQSGTRSRTPTPVIRSTASASDSMCWMLTVVMTAMPASRISSTSSQRFSWRPEPGTLVWASSSMRTTSGWRARTASRSISSQVESRYSHLLARHDRQVADLLHGVGPLVRLDEPDDDVGPALEAAPPLVEHGARLADAGRRAEVDAEPPGRAGHPRLRRCSLISTSLGRTPSVRRYTRKTLRRTESCDARETKAGWLPKATYQRTVLGHRRHAGRPRRAPGRAAALPGPPEHRHPGTGVRPARAGRRRHRRLRPRRRRARWRASSSTTTSSSRRTTPSPSARRRTGSRSWSTSSSC